MRHPLTLLSLMGSDTRVLYVQFCIHTRVSHELCGLRLVAPARAPPSSRAAARLGEPLAHGDLVAAVRLEAERAHELRLCTSSDISRSSSASPLTSAMLSGSRRCVFGVGSSSGSQSITRLKPLALR